MTLKEIYKIIDEADSFLFKDGDVYRSFTLDNFSSRAGAKNAIEYYIGEGCLYIFFKFKNKSDGEIEKSWFVDHIDKEKKKKIIKKKLDDMTQEEINYAKEKYCSSVYCDKCPLSYPKDGRCMIHFLTYKNTYLENKDKEIEFEVEE